MVETNNNKNRILRVQYEIIFRSHYFSHATVTYFVTLFRRRQFAYKYRLNQNSLTEHLPVASLL